MLAPPQPVSDMKEKWQQGKSWVEENKVGGDCLEWCDYCVTLLCS